VLKEERHKTILNILSTKGTVSVILLCKILKVSEMTIRRDLDELAETNAMVRVRGGAMLPHAEMNLLTEPPFETRMEGNFALKNDIAHAALEYIKDGQKIFIDSGSTNCRLAQILDNKKQLVVVTNAINIIVELLPRTNITLFPIGGDLRKHTYSCTGYFAEETIKNLKVDISFVGVSGISSKGKLYNLNTMEIGVKRAMLDVAPKVIILADASKIGREDFISFGDLRSADTLITNDSVSENFLRTYTVMGVDVKVAERIHS